MLVGLASCLGYGGVCNATSAESWPDRPITVVVPFPAGGSVDAVFRMLSPLLTERLGQSVLVENVGGASGAIGAARVAQAKPDGYTLLAGSINDVVLQPALKPSTRYRISDFEPISLVFTSPFILVGRNDLPYSGIDGLVQALRSNPRSLNYGSPGVGTIQQLIAEDLQYRTKTEMVHVPYRGAAPLINDLLGGQIDLAVMAPPAALPHLLNHRIKSFGLIGEKRLSAYPDLPTINESRTVSDMDLVGWVGVFVPNGVPVDRVRQVQKALAEVLQLPKVRQRILDIGMEPVTSFERADMDARIANDLKTLETLNVQLEK
ncbi:MAG: tripartite tricarboxylate transporter substrate binding protein [Achromobacter sp.]|uniref:Bug family tripartite tricarboxylate transporter substrate binding protein n=1 Tax=Achromobacter sp. TaxID=134375 RepID=UPI0029A582D3|nr:tripartite tricarboxylate transporter substrate binding protein [Achromobacter sp.]MDX3985717.1 tripartite tricarboxylate transporter substrate binding protein [Achromobacter sp.]